MKHWKIIYGTGGNGTKFRILILESLIKIFKFIVNNNVKYLYGTIWKMKHKNFVILKLKKNLKSNFSEFNNNLKIIRTEQSKFLK